MENIVIGASRFPDALLGRLESREVALWIRNLPKSQAENADLAQFIGLPWKLVLTEVYDSRLFDEIEAEGTTDNPLIRKRGFVQVIDSDPSRIELPQRCLPVLLLNGRSINAPQNDFESRLRRMTMLEELRRTAIRDVVVIAYDDADLVDPVPPELKELWTSGFRGYFTFVSKMPSAADSVTEWAKTASVKLSATLVPDSAASVVRDVLVRYAATYPEQRRIVRVRDVKGALQKVDITDVDEPERPVLEKFSLIEERDLSAIVPEELAESEFVGFFQDPTNSWRPYAAGLPWTPSLECRTKLFSYLRQLDSDGPEETCIAYISSESGAGGTTLARWLAFTCAREGYPSLLAKQLPFDLNALPVANFLNRVHNKISAAAPHSQGGDNSRQRREGQTGATRLYETPWLVVFDTIHTQYREGELVQFRNEMEKAGRPVCLLAVTGPDVGPAYSNRAVFRKLIDLNHAIELGDARELGRHLNVFLRNYGKQRSEWQWDRFHEDHTVRYLEGIAAFWVALSFWIQGQFDLSESIQEWMYRSFRLNAADAELKLAILLIAALSTERLPLPERLLPKSATEFPISFRLSEARSSLAALGLTRLKSDGENYWALIHDILGRLLINALYYDPTARRELGFSEAKDPDHLRFLLLQQIAQHPLLGERAYKNLGEDFATTIFKIDPDHGLGTFAGIWREAISALDAMPRSLRDTSRLFRHHVAVSRRRIAKLDERLYEVSASEKLALLNGAIRDVLYALTQIPYTPGSESNLNLYNSLANAYLDLADVEASIGAPHERLLEIQRLANDATRRAYDESPTNSFVIETYVKNLLRTARDNVSLCVESCIEILGIVFSALTSNEAAYRASQLNSLAGQALALLLQQRPPNATVAEPANSIDVLVSAWKILAEGEEPLRLALSDLPEANRLRAITVLEHAAGQGSVQVILLRYDLVCLSRPHAFNEQLELIEQLQATNHRITPQLRLEYAILLFQNSRNVEGDKAFRALRQLWRESEHFVEVPERLRWLRGPDGDKVKTVHATIQADYRTRVMARVTEFQGANVPLRPEEHGIRDLRVGMRLVCTVSFGHNGPFLRPVTAGPRV